MKPVVVDGHNDLPWAIRTRAGGDLTGADPRRRLAGYQTDFPRMVEGGVAAQFWSVFVPAWQERPFDAVMQQIDLVEEMAGLGSDFTETARSAADVTRIRASGRFASLLGAEGGHAIENSLTKLETLAERGVRYLTLTHADTISWADSATDEARHGGLTDFGRTVVASMNDLGMIVDISHVAHSTMRQAVEVSRAPVIASHSSVYSIAPHPRNVPDDVIEMVAAGGGVVMVTFVPAFLVASTAAAALDMFAIRRRLRAEYRPDQEAEFEEEIAARVNAMDLDKGSVADIADHIEHIERLVGVDFVGIGSDFDGVEVLPAGMEDASCYPNLARELARRSWEEGSIRKVMGENALRVLAEAEAAAV